MVHSQQQVAGHSWVVCPDGGFNVFDAGGRGVVSLTQVDESVFEVGSEFRFENADVESKLIDHLMKVRAFTTRPDAAAAVKDASRYRAGSGNSDLASIPPFMRWLTNTYGTHTLAAILHDELIRTKPNDGAMRSDVVSDRFFREMLRACEVGVMTSWVMWTGVALRTRWKAGAFKRLKVCVWVLCSIVGIGGTAWLLGVGRPGAAAGYAAVTLAAAALLWGRQWGAAVVAAVTLPFIAPAAALAIIARGLIAVLNVVFKPFVRSRRS